MVSFNQVPNTRVPFVYAEFDTSKANQGPALQKFTALIIAQKFPKAGAIEGDANVLYPITSDAEAIRLFGDGSQITEMIKKFRKANSITLVKAIGLDDAAAGVPAAGSVDFTGAATESGVLSLYIAGKRYQVAVASGDAATDAVTALTAEINADDSRLVDAVTNIAALELTARNDGFEGNSIDIRFDYRSDEKIPLGLTVVTNAMAAGAGPVDIQDAIDVMSDEQFKVIIAPYTDTTNLDSMKVELEDRWGPIRQNDGVYFSAKKDTFGNMSTFGAARNNEHETVIDAVGPSYPAYWAAVVGAVAAKSLEIDPARPLQTLALTGILAGDSSEVRTFQEQDALLQTGIATHQVSDDGTVRIQRLITTYQKNDAGADDTAYLDVNTLFNLSYLRYDFRIHFLTKFPRHKLAKDGTRVAPGQATLTPKTAKAEIVNKFRQWEELGLVEGADQFIEDLIVEISATDPNRLDVQLSPDLINQLRVVGAQFAFLL